MKRPAIALLLLLALVAHGEEPAPTFQIDTKASELRLEVKKRGALKAFAHDHEIAANVFTGSVVWDAAAPDKASVKLEVATKDLVVLDPHLSASDRASVQKTMHSDEVLSVAKFPTITFASTAVVLRPKKAGGEQPLAVMGKLTLHGQTRGVTIEVLLVEKDGNVEVTGEHALKQSEFGMEPYSTGLGAIGVQDVVTLKFKVVSRR